MLLIVTAFLARAMALLVLQLFGLRCWDQLVGHARVLLPVVQIGFDYQAVVQVGEIVQLHVMTPVI